MSARVRGEHGKVADGEARHLGLGVGAAHAVGVHHREPRLAGDEKGLDGVAAPDLEGHDRPEAPAQVRSIMRTGFTAKAGSDSLS